MPKNLHSSKNKPARTRYKAEGRREKNKARKKMKQERIEARKKAKLKARKSKTGQEEK